MEEKGRTQREIRELLSQHHCVTDRGLRGVARGCSQQLFGGVEWSNVPRDEDRLPAEVYDGGHAHSVWVQSSSLPLKFLRSLQQVLVLLAVKLCEEVKGDG